MAINVDRVYQTVLKIVNMEMGMEMHINHKDFNLYANLAQRKIYESYFTEKYARNRIPSDGGDYSDLSRNVSEKIKHLNAVSAATSKAGSSEIFPYPSDLYRLGVVNAGNVEVDEVSDIDALRINRSDHTKPTARDPIYVRRSSGVTVFPSSITSVIFIYVRELNEVSWAPSSSGAYDSSTSVNFDLHDSEEQELVAEILMIAGTAMKQPLIIQAATGMKQMIEQEENIS